MLLEAVLKYHAKNFKFEPYAKTYKPKTFGCKIRQSEYLPSRIIFFENYAVNKLQHTAQLTHAQRWLFSIGGQGKESWFGHASICGLQRSHVKYGNPYIHNTRMLQACTRRLPHISPADEEKGRRHKRGLHEQQFISRVVSSVCH